MTEIQRHKDGRPSPSVFVSLSVRKETPHYATNLWSRWWKGKFLVRLEARKLACRKRGLLEVKAVHQDIYQPPDGEHDKDADNAPDDVLLGLRSLLFVSRARDVVEDAPDDDKHRKSDEERDDGVDNIVYLVDEVGNVVAFCCVDRKRSER